MFSDIENTAPDNITDQNGISAIKIYSNKTKSAIPKLKKNENFSRILVKILPEDIAKIPISFRPPQKSASKPARLEPTKPAKKITIIRIPIFKFKSPSSAPPSVLRASRKNPNSVLKIFHDILKNNLLTRE